MHHRILITGSCGLIGSALRRALAGRHVEVVGLDLRANGEDAGDIRDPERVAAALKRCHGVVHLAAVSRVVWGERDPARCRAINIGGLRNLLAAIRRRPDPPWLIFASSREVYGQPDALPVCEDSPLQAMNLYGRTKVAGERLVAAARNNGLRAAVVRLSNVYGSTADHADRVVPAFARAAALGRPLRVDGAGHTFDFTHIDDATRGIVALVLHLSRGGKPPPPIHFLTGQPTTLGQLAHLAVAIADSRSPIVEAPPRTYDVTSFYGDPARACDLLGWSPQVTVGDGLARLIQDFRSALAASATQGMTA